MSDSLYVGLMSGTSTDGVDAVLTKFSSSASGTTVLAICHSYIPFELPLSQSLLALNTPGHDELHRASLLAKELTRIYAQVTADVIAKAELPAGSRIRAIGAHGQTIRHRPDLGYTVQLLDPALLAELTGIDVVCDFRRRDVAANGQGAPLVPGFHQAVFRDQAGTVAVLNLGGFANLTVIDGCDPPRGFDCGPANALLDEWAQRQFRMRFDRDGELASRGRVHGELLQTLLADPYFAAPPPKSTGRDYFNWDWLAERLASHGIQLQAAQKQPHQLALDVMATLAELTAQTCAEAFRQHAAPAKTLLVCGGGANNPHLISRLRALLPGVAVESTETRGLPPMWVEAAAFAWLAHAFCERIPANVPAVTGAKGPRVLGALYPA